jgi:hypothetical protein
MMLDATRPKSGSYAMRAPFSNDISISALDERGSSDASVPPSAAQEQLVETSLVELSALLIVILTGLALVFAGAIVALSLA